jgi:hypothetical protein
MAINPGPRPDPGPPPTSIGSPAVLVDVAIGVTVLPRPLDTYTVRASPAKTRPFTGLPPLAHMPVPTRHLLRGSLLRSRLCSPPGQASQGQLRCR